ncbi:MAG: hypothetical protein KY456_04965 [Chloroflexi bacterium]|nr:hypothetical protein [Chloroflexota bacterium]
MTLTQIASTGVFVALPIIGYWVAPAGRLGIAGWAMAPVTIAAGLAVASVPLLGLVVLGLYRPELIGLGGWLVVALWAFRTRRSLRMPRLRPSWTDGVLFIGLLVASGLYLALPADPTITGRDMAVYAALGTFIAEHGRLDVPYPVGVTPGDLPPGWVGFAGLYDTKPTQTVQFGHLFPAWLAQAFALGGFDALIRLNAVLAPLSALAVHTVARTLLPAPMAAIMTLFLAFNAGQVWVARNTLTEILSQLLIWCAFALLLTPGGSSTFRLAWSGVFISVACFVRIDVLIVLPLLVLGMTLAGATDEERFGVRRYVPFLATAAPGAFMAAAYYAVFSEPYWSSLSVQLRLIGVLTAAAGILYVAVQLPPVRSALGAMVRSLPFLALAVTATASLAIFAYFIRPHLEPFDLLDSPGHRLDGTRSHVEDAMVNLAGYVGPPVVWLGISAWTCLTTIALRRWPAGLPVLLAIGGASALYFWNQSIFPDHFWAIRRFIPIVMPAMVVLGGVGGWFVIRHFPARARVLVVVILVLALVAQAWRAGTPAFFVPERLSTHGTLTSFASDLGTDVPFLGLFSRGGVGPYPLPLYLMFDVPVIALHPVHSAGRAEALRRLRQASPDAPVSVITDFPLDDPFFTSNVIASRRTAFEYMPRTLEPPPAFVAESTLSLTAKSITGVRTVGVRFGASPSWLVEEDGFHEVEASGDRQQRWTDGTAMLRLPIIGGPAMGVRIDLGSGGPNGGGLIVRVAGKDQHVLVPAGGWTGVVEFDPPLQEGAFVEIVLTSDTFVPATVLPGSSDTRQLGVLIHGIELMASPP